MFRLLVALTFLFSYASAVGAPDEAMLYQSEPSAPDNDYAVKKAPREVNDYTGMEYLDWSQKFASRYVESLNDGVDSFFVSAFFDDEIIEDEFSGSNGRIYFLSRSEDGAEPNYKVGLNLRLVLPRTRDRFKLLVETDDSDPDQNETNVLDTTDNVTYSTAIRVDFKERRNWKTSFDNGVRWAGEPVYFSRVRVRRTDYFDIWRTRVLQQISWRTDDEWGAQFNSSAIRPLDFTRHLRLGFNADYLLNDDFAELDSSVAIFDEISSRSAMLYQLAVFGDTENLTKINNTVLSVTYRRKLFKQYLFAEIVPELGWPREGEFETTPAITFQLEMILGESK